MNTRHITTNIAINTFSWMFKLCITVAVMSAFVGCMAAELDDEFPEIGSVQNNVSTENALTDNALTVNALTVNALTVNALTVNALSPGVLELNYSNAGTLRHTSLGRQLLKYTARCAYSATEQLYLDGDLGPAQFPGRLGLATVWKTGGLDQDYKELMTACLLAHLNAFGTSVPLSVRYAGAATTGDMESETYFVGDGVFYGDLYASSPSRYACSIRQKSGESPAVDSEWSNLRICDQDNCSVVHTGFCDEVCDTIVEDNHQWHFSSCHDGKPEAERTYYDWTFSVWLQGHDAPPCQPGNSSWRGFTCKPS